MITVLYSVGPVCPISDFGFRSLLRLYSRLCGIARISRVSFYDIPFTVRFTLPFGFSFRRFIMSLMDLAIFSLICFIIYAVFCYSF